VRLTLERRRYAQIRIRRWCSRLLGIDACLLVKIVFLLSRMSTKIDFCGATGHHGGWQVAAAAVTETTSTAEAAAVGGRRHRQRQWRRRKHRHRVVVDDGDGTPMTITTTMTATVTTTTVERGVAVAV
jgi:hypothetical protein